MSGAARIMSPSTDREQLLKQLIISDKVDQVNHITPAMNGSPCRIVILCKLCPSRMAPSTDTSLQRQVSSGPACDRTFFLRRGAHAFSSSGYVEHRADCRALCGNRLCCFE